jgi:hypothetical protein
MRGSGEAMSSAGATSWRWCRPSRLGQRRRAAQIPSGCGPGDADFTDGIACITPRPVRTRPSHLSPWLVGAFALLMIRRWWPRPGVGQHALGGKQWRLVLPYQRRAIWWRAWLQSHLGVEKCYHPLPACSSVCGRRWLGCGSRSTDCDRADGCQHTLISLGLAIPGPVGGRWCGLFD